MFSTVLPLRCDQGADRAEFVGGTARGFRAARGDRAGGRGGGSGVSGWGGADRAAVLGGDWYDHARGGWLVGLSAAGGAGFSVAGGGQRGGGGFAVSDAGMGGDAAADVRGAGVRKGGFGFGMTGVGFRDGRGR